MLNYVKVTAMHFSKIKRNKKAAIIL